MDVSGHLPLSPLPHINQDTHAMQFSGALMQNYRGIIVSMIVWSLFPVTSATFAGDETSVNQDPRRIAARVNGRPILLAELQPALQKAEARFRKYGAREGLSDETRKRLQQEELDRLIALEMLAQAGEKCFGKEIERKVDEKITAEQAHDSGMDKPVSAAKHGVDGDEHRKQVRNRLLVDEYLAKHGAKDMAVPESELKKYYEQNAGSFREPEKIKVSHILVKLSAKPTAEEIAKAKNEIEQIRAEIMSGKDFPDMAKQRSACASANAGGDLGYISRTYMPKGFDDIAFALKVGEISEPVRTLHGFHLIKAFDRKPARVPELGEIQSFIEKALAGEIQKKRVDEIVRELRREAKVEIFLD